MPIFGSPFASGEEDPFLSNLYASQLAKLLPPGVLWNLEPGSNLSKTLLGISDELERVRVRGAALIEESDPRTATETLSDWESALGLPDTRVTSIPTTVAKRRIAITQKYVARGGQSFSYFSDLCYACGYLLDTADLGAWRTLRVGARVGDRVYGDAYAYSVIFAVVKFSADALSHADFERVIRHVLHSHIRAGFLYL